MSERQSRGFIPPDVAEQCKVLGPDGKPCNLMQGEIIFYCQVKGAIAPYLTSGDLKDRIMDFSSQIPTNCPLGYYKFAKK